MDADVIIMGAGNAGRSERRRRRAERGATCARAREGGARVVRGQLGLHRGGHADRPRRGRGLWATCLEADGGLPATDLEPYTEADFPGRHAAGHARPRRRGDGPRAGGRLGAAVRWLSSRGIRFRLMYERQSYEADGRHGSGAGSRSASSTAGAG